MKNGASKKYFRDALASVSERFSNFGGDELGGLGGFAGGNFAGNDLNAAGVNIHQYNAKTSSPYEVRVQNTTPGALTAIIFGSDNNRTAANFGNPVGITITSATPNINYLQQLAASEKSNFEVGMTYIQVEAGSTAVLTATWNLTYLNQDGELVSKPLAVKKSPNQFQNDVIEFYYTFPLGGLTQISVSIPANTTAVYSFYPSATENSGRQLINAPAVREYGKPTISQPVPMTISPKAMQALVGASRPGAGVGKR